MSKKPSTKEPASPKDVARPIPPYVGHHPMAEMINDPETERELTAVGVCSVDGMPGQFCTFIVKFCGDKVLDVAFSQPDFKVGALRRSHSEFTAAFLMNKPI